MGDQVLQAFCPDGAGPPCATPDMLARWGGEEFVLMLYDSDAASALGLLERVRPRCRPWSCRSTGAACG